MRTLGLALMITGGLVVWYALGKKVQSGQAGESSGGSGFDGGTASGGNAGGGGGSW